jgi:hypothetical protein
VFASSAIAALALALATLSPVYALPSMGVRAVISANSLQVQPGAGAAVTVSIRNTGAVVDNFHVDVLGAAASWTSVQPPTLPLFPDAQGVVTIDFRPPRSSNILAGSIPFGVRVASEVHPGDATVEEGTLEVGAFTELKAELIPEISRSSRTGRHQLACDNLGNTPVMLGFRATDPENALRFSFRPRNVVAQPGTATIVRVGVRPRHRILAGTARTSRFQITVQPQGAEVVNISGSLVQTPVVPKMIVALAGLVAVAAVGALVWIGPLHSGKTSTPTSAPTSAPLSTPTPSPTPSPSPSPTPSPSPSPTPTPTPAPTFGNFTLLPFPSFSI